jgi:hypothetical protein
MPATAIRSATVPVTAPVHLAAARPGMGARFAPEYLALMARGAASAIVATCGRALAYLPCECADAPSGRTLLPYAALKALKRTKRNPAPAVTLTDSGVRTPDGATMPYPDGSFPSVADVIPAELGNRVAVAFNAELLANLAASIGATDGKVTMYLDPENRKPAVMVPHGADGFGLLMPCAHDDNAKRRAEVEAELAAARALTK